jgi:hypothetical protein
MMQVKLGLTKTELMKSPWISLIMATNDFPYYDHRAKRIIKGDQANEILNKYIK